MLHPELLGVIACPKCRQGMQMNKQKNALECKKCGKNYKIENNSVVVE